MKRVLNIVMAAGVMLLWGMAAYAQEAGVDGGTEWFTRFSRCDGEFFRALKENQGVFSKVAPMGEGGDYAWFKVEDRQNKRGSDRVLFQQPVRVGNVDLLGYYDELRDFKVFGVRYSWGFLARGTEEEVREGLEPWVFENKRFNQNHYRLELRQGEQWEWFQDGFVWEISNANYARRIFSIQKELLEAPMVRIECSVEGGLNERIVEEVRPDVAPEERVLVQVPVKFEEIPISEEVLAALQAAIPKSGSGWWKPKFKRLYYVQEKIKDSGEKSLTRVELEAVGEDKVRLTVIGVSNDRLIEYVDSWSLEAVAGLVPLKWRDGGGQISDWTPKIVSLSLPENLTLGQVFKIEAESIVENIREPGEVQVEDRRCYEVGEQFPAREIFPDLTGQAITLRGCPLDVSGRCQYSFVITYLEDLGITVDVERNDPTTRLLSFEVER